MSRTLTLSDDTYKRLETAAWRRGLHSVEQLIEEWQVPDELGGRQAPADQIDALRERLFAKYGEMPDSTILLREDRDR